MIQVSQRALTPEETKDLLARGAGTKLHQLSPYLLSGIVGLTIAFAVAPAFTLFGLPRALSWGVALLVFGAGAAFSRRRQQKALEIRRAAADASIAERVAFSASGGLGVLGPTSKRIGLLLDCGDDDVVYLALSAFPTRRTEWKAGEQFPERFTLEWIPQTGDVLASRADGEARPIHTTIAISSLPVTDETRFKPLRRDQLEPQELLLLEAQSTP